VGKFGLFMIKGSVLRERELQTKADHGISVDDVRSVQTELRILLTGPMSGPVGGVSTHLNRLCSLLNRWGFAVELVDEGRDISKSVYNLRSMKIIPYLKRLKRCNIAHIQSSLHIFRWFHLIMCRLLGLYVVVTIHSWRSNNFVTALNRLFLKLAHRVIVVNEEIAIRLKLLTYDVIPAFLPPVYRTNDLPVEIRHFIDSARAKRHYLLCSNASKLAEYKGQDLYGLDLCVQLVDDLKFRMDIDVALIFVVTYPATDNPLFINAQKQIAERGLKEHFFLYNKPLDFVTLMTSCDAVLRPTNTDGDALTVREALYLGLPVIASDSAKRPAGTILFRSRDSEDFASHTIAVLKGEINIRTASQDNDGDKDVLKYVDIYRSVIVAKYNFSSPFDLSEWSRERLL
jgi:glycosyltransferase involved in cell wall biosynthesis